MVIFCITSFAQNSLSGVEKALPELRGEERLEALVQLAEFYSKTDNQKFLEYSHQAVVLAKDSDDEVLIIKVLQLNGTALIQNKDFATAKLIFKRALQLAEDKGIGSSKEEIYSNLGAIYIATAQYDSAMQWYKKSLGVLEKSKSKMKLGKAYTSVALVYWRYGANKEAHDYFSKALSIWEELDNDSLRSRSLNSLGSVHSRWGNYSRAYEMYNQSLILAKKVKDNEQITKVTINLGFIYFSLKNYDKAKQSFLEGRDLAKKHNYTAMVAYSELSLGMISNETKSYEEAIRAYRESAEIYRQLNDLTSLGQALEGLGRGYFNMGLYAKAEDSFKEALDVSLSVKNEYSLAQSYLSYGLMLSQLGRLKESGEHLYKALIIAEKNGFIEQLKISHDLLSKVHRRKGETEQALLHFKKYISIKDSTNSAKVSSDIVNLQISFAVERQENENRILRLDNELQEAELSTLNTVILALVIFATLLGFGLFAFYRLIKVRKMNAEKLAVVNLSLDELNFKLENQNDLIQKTILTRDTLFSIIAHDLKSPFSAMLGYTEMLVEDIEEMEPEEVKTYSQHINQSSRNLHALVNNLFEWTRAQNEKINLEPVILDVEQVVKGAVETYHTLSREKEIRTVLNIKPNSQVYADEHTFTAVIRNLYSNAVKFTPRGGTITISSEIYDEETFISISDSGVGMSVEQVAVLMESGSRSTTPGTDGEKGTGLGLMVCKEFVVRNNGVLSIASEKGSGSSFTVKLPKGSNTN